MGLIKGLISGIGKAVKTGCKAAAKAVRGAARAGRAVHRTAGLFQFLKRAFPTLVISTFFLGCVAYILIIRTAEAVSDCSQTGRVRYAYENGILVAGMEGPQADSTSSTSSTASVNWFQVAAALFRYLGSEDCSEDYARADVSDAGFISGIFEEHVEEAEYGYMDEYTLQRILKAVDEYNREASRMVNVTYTYRVEKVRSGIDFPACDALSGEITQETLDGFLAENQAVYDKEDFEPAENAQAGGTQTEGQEAQTEAGTEASSQEIELSDIYSVTYEEAENTLCRTGIEHGGRIEGLSEDLFYIDWQPVVALCILKIQENYLNWGDYDTSDGYMEDGEAVYYLSDEEIDEIIDIFAYKYDYKRDIGQRDGVNSVDLTFDELSSVRGYGYFLTTTRGEDTMDEDGFVWNSRITVRTPYIAPASISNSYISCVYNYELQGNGQVLVSRSCVVDPQKFYERVKECIGGFRRYLFLDVLERLPDGEGMTAYYEELLFAEDTDAYEIYADDSSECPLIGLYVDNRLSMGSGLSYADSGEGVIVKLQPYVTGSDEDIIRSRIYPGEWLVEEGNTYGEWLVSAEALAPLDVSDNLSQDQILTLLTDSDVLTANIRESVLLNSEQARKDTAECLYKFQERNNASVCGLLAIMRQEGGFTSGVAVRGWNFFNISVGSSSDYSGINGYSRFRDYKSVFDSSVNTSAPDGYYETDAVNALSAQIDWIYLNYWSRGQNTYYSMSFNGYNGEAGTDAYAGLSHCYCPPWDDRAMPYSNDSYRTYYGNDGSVMTFAPWGSSNASYRGWVNNCGTFRGQFYAGAQ